jgi:hypothetical protein
VRPDEVEEILNSIPDLHPALATYGPDELIALFDAYDVSPPTTSQTVGSSSARTSSCSSP